MTTDIKRTRVLQGAALMVSAAVALVGSGAAVAAAPGHVDGGRDPVMRDVARQVLSVGVPGYVARIDYGRKVGVTLAGVADRRDGRKLTVRDQFEVGSNTKTFTAVLALQLVDQGKLRLDSPVEKYLPGVVPNGRNITVRMLLQHTSGLFNYTADPDFFVDIDKRPQHVHTENELLAVAFKHAPNFAPGTDWAYSNTNYILIGMVLQKLTGRSLPALVEQRIAAPLGLVNTYFADPRAINTGPGYARGYSVSFAGTSPVYTDVSARPLGGWAGAAGAVISTPAELSRFFEALLGGDLISAEQLKQMKTTVELGEGFGEGGYGLGLMRIDSPCGTVWGHGGDTLGHHSAAVTTENGRRSAVTDATAEPSDTSPNEGVLRFVKVVQAADTVTICRMLDKPAPQAVMDALRS
ncbi:serine hydrolase domain-containing protein [Actinoplanes derwentensis]|uniref:D-alanyl-D-alanine carboxypeptidase n=1 Tax=Actinoplanes derwentensis TaxID=113562 RepID=A0A1H2CLU0_9ACTN|nr:serine hydrolase domain-containing protein [Actinoplanes derwentensis]GID86134.1 serine hydrolase [Actinoplanes derwentensis]SDT71478.1 D-alanyl-D-alanine carboxypeptidase [Actinoplanes derwentensis]